MKTLFQEEWPLISKALGNLWLWRVLLLCAAWLAFAVPSMPLALAYSVFTAGLLLLARIDFKTFTLPLLLTIPLLVLGFALSFVVLPISPVQSLVGLSLGFMLFAALSFIMRRALGREALGLGDALLLAIMGAWGGGGALLPTLLLGSLSALCFIPVRTHFGFRQGHFLPFGPFLAVGGWVGVVHQAQFWHMLARLHQVLGVV